MKLTEEEVKGLFLKCQNINKDGLFHGEYPDALDLIEFAQHVADYVSSVEYKRGAKDEHKRCVELAHAVNPVVGRFLLDKKEYAE